jgi:hypothetical protein
MENMEDVYSITCMDPVYVTQTTIAVTILHKIHYSIEVPKANKKGLLAFKIKNSEKIWKMWKKSKLNGEKIWKIWKKSKLKCEMVFPAPFPYYSSSTFSHFPYLFTIQLTFPPYFPYHFTVS